MCESNPDSPSALALCTNAASWAHAGHACTQTGVNNVEYGHPLAKPRKRTYTLVGPINSTTKRHVLQESSQTALIAFLCTRSKNHNSMLPPTRKCNQGAQAARPYLAKNPRAAQVAQQRGLEGTDLVPHSTACRSSGFPEGWPSRQAPRREGRAIELAALRLAATTRRVATKGDGARCLDSMPASVVASYSSPTGVGVKKEKKRNNHPRHAQHTTRRTFVAVMRVEALRKKVFQVERACSDNGVPPAAS